MTELLPEIASLNEAGYSRSRFRTIIRIQAEKLMSGCEREKQESVVLDGVFVQSNKSSVGSA